MNYRRKILSASILASLCLAASGTYAQTAPAVATPDGPDAQNSGGAGASKADATEMDTIIVTGIRESLKKSLDNMDITTF